MGIPTVVVHIPHASTVVPDSLRPSIALSDQDLAHELLLMTDRYTDDLFDVPAESAVTVKFPVSRLVVDPERFIDDKDEPMAAVGMGAVYVKTSSGLRLRSDLTESERVELLSTYYVPHHQILTNAVASAVAAHGQCLILDGHSFPSQPLPHEPDQDVNRCDICIGTDAFHTPKQLKDLAMNEFRAQGFHVDVNRPFSGSLVPTAFYQHELRVRSLMIEVNRSLYMDETTGARLESYDAVATRVQNVMRAIIAESAS